MTYEDEVLFSRFDSLFNKKNIVDEIELDLFKESL